VTTNPHDPGPDASGARAEPIGDAAAEPLKAAGDHQILIGTASWTDPTMTVPGVFYPRGADSAEERLQFYAGRFPLVEVDSTYYALPAKRTAELWAERTPPDFTFDVKAHAVMTFQPTETKRLPKDVREALPPALAEKPRVYGKDLPPELLDEMYARFADGLEPLRASGQLGAILLQFPRWWFPSHENRAAIEDARERLAKHDMRVTVEFRNGTWFNDKNRDRTLAFLAERQIPLVVVDEPQGLRTSVPPIVEVTSPDLAIVRFHGRRAETWEARGVPPVERFRYLYSRDELEEWVPKVRAMASEARETHVLMNNCYSNYGSTNARELAALLQDLSLTG
jgi:uncharacterized protein YecE (DUF72 family)